MRVKYLEQLRLRLKMTKIDPVEFPICFLSSLVGIIFIESIAFPTEPAPLWTLGLSIWASVGLNLGAYRIAKYLKNSS